MPSSPSKRKAGEMAHYEPQVVDVAKLKKGDILSNTEYFIVDTPSGGPTFGEYVMVRTLDGSQSISHDLIKYKSYKTPTQFATTEKVCRSKIIEVLRDQVKSHTFLVEFKKKDGSQRTMTGHLANFCGMFGRSDVMELVEKGGKFQEQKRQVDHRTITRLVFNNVEYISTSK
jgi:hypothetical protein